MAAPEHVRVEPGRTVRGYESPPRRPGSWVTDRPGEIDFRQPAGPGLGNQGPDQGYVLRLAREFHDRLVLQDGEHRADVVAGCAEVALKRASIFGRAPMIHDLTVAFTIWGFLDGNPPDDLVDLRREMFEGVANPHHYMERRRISDMIPVESLRLTPTQILDRSVAPDATWRSKSGEDQA